MAQKRYGEDDILRLIREVEVHCSIGVAASADTNPLKTTFYGSFCKPNTYQTHYFSSVK